MFIWGFIIVFGKGKFTMTPGFSVHAYGNRNIQFGEEIKEISLFVFYPILRHVSSLKKENL